VAQKKPQLTYMASCGWWRGGGRTPFNQPQFTTWASYGFFCATLCGTRLFLSL